MITLVNIGFPCWVTIVAWSQSNDTVAACTLSCIRCYIYIFSSHLRFLLKSFILNHQTITTRILRVKQFLWILKHAVNHKPSLGSRGLTKKCGPDRFSHFDVFFWIQTKKLTSKVIYRCTIYKLLKIRKR